jgi:molecular chaperone GrpE
MTAADDRAALIALCLYAYDRAHSPAIAARIERGLAGVGVGAVRPDGERFDPARHEAGGVQCTVDAALDGTVAETELAGFVDARDDGTVLRVPIVTVYRAAR